MWLTQQMLLLTRIWFQSHQGVWFELNKILHEIIELHVVILYSWCVFMFMVVPVVFFFAKLSVCNQAAPEIVQKAKKNP